MLEPSKGRFDGKEGLLDKSLSALPSEEAGPQIRQCKRCGSPMDISVRTSTIVGFIWPIPGYKYKFLCRGCSKKITIRSPFRFMLNIILSGLFLFALFIILIGPLDKSDILPMTIGILILLMWPVETIIEIYRRIKYPLIKE